MLSIFQIKVHQINVTLPNLNLKHMGPEVPELWSYKQTDRQTETTTLFIFYIYKVVISVCLFVCFICLSDHNSGTPGPIGLKFWLGNLGGPRECSLLGLKILSWVVIAIDKNIRNTWIHHKLNKNIGRD